MSIKERIGQRIKQQRLNLGLTRKELSELTSTMKISRINNYERGDRTPGPEEIQELAKALQVSPSFLMCLTDNNPDETISPANSLIPVLDYREATKPIFSIDQTASENRSEKKTTHVLVHPDLAKRIGNYAFAVKIRDESMTPEFRIQDFIIVDPDITPDPGDYVAARLAGEEEIIIRKYRQISLSKNPLEFELIAFNPDWASVKIMNEVEGEIIGTVINLTRIIK